MVQTQRGHPGDLSAMEVGGLRLRLGWLVASSPCSCLCPRPDWGDPTGFNLQRPVSNLVTVFQTLALGWQHMDFEGSDTMTGHGDTSQVFILIIIIII